MPDLTTLSLFAATAFVMQMMPGPAIIYIVTRSIEQGWQAGWASSLGIVVGVCAHTLAAMLGISAILMTSATAFSIVKYLGAAYLIYLGLQKLFETDQKPSTEARSLSTQSSAQHLSSSRQTVSTAQLSTLFRQGIMVNVLNPKAAIFFLAFLPQFINPAQGPAWSQSLILGLVFAGLGVITGGLYILLAAPIRHMLSRTQGFQRAERYVSGGTYIALGVATAAEGNR